MSDTGTCPLVLGPRQKFWTSEYFDELFRAADRNNLSSNRLWPIEDFKRWILREYKIEFTTVVAHACEEQPLLQLSDYRPDHHLLHLTEGIEGKWHVSYEDASAWCRRLAAARLFVEKEINDVLQDYVANFPPEPDESNESGAYNHYWRGIACVVWLGVRSWRSKAFNLRRKCLRLVLLYSCSACFPFCNSTPTRDDVDALIDMIAKARQLRAYGMTLLQTRHIYYYDERSPLRFQLKKIREMMSLVVARCTRICCRSGHIPADTQQLQTLLRAVLRSTTPFEPYKRVQLIRRTVPDDSDVLLELQREALQPIFATHCSVLVAYYLQRQPRIFGPNRVLVAVVEQVAIREEKPDARRSLELMLQDGLRFEPGSSGDDYDGVLYMLSEDNYYQMKDVNYFLYWVVQFGMPLDLRISRQDDEWSRTHDADWHVESCTLLEKLVLKTAGRNTGKGWRPPESELNFPQSRRITATRYLIAEGSPVPVPEIFERLLKNFALSTLFALLFVLYRAGRKVVLPEFVAGSRDSPRTHPAYYRTFAVLVHEMILRCNRSPCPRTYLDELQRIGKAERSDQVDALKTLAFRALRRNIRSAFSPCSFPRITLDNYDELAGVPSHGEIHLPLINSFVPPRFAPKFNLTDLMDQYRASVTRTGLDELVWL